MEIYTINSHHADVPEVAYLVKVDGLVIYHNGDYRGDYQEDYPHLKGISDSIDICFFGSEPREEFQYIWQFRNLLETFPVRVVFPMHGAAEEHLYQEFARAVREKGYDVPFYSAEHKGECYFIPNLQGSYLGESPPGKIPELFAPELLPVEHSWHSAPVFSPDGQELYYSSFIRDRYRSETIFSMRCENGHWTLPAVTDFSGEHFDGSPCFTPDGQRLLFASDRPVEPGSVPRRDRDIWYVDRIEDGWSEPVRIPWSSDAWEDRMRVSELGNIYFQSGTDIYRMKMHETGFSEPERLDPPINSEFGEIDPCIAPDERFMVFYSSRPGGYSTESAELYVSFRRNDGSWGEVINLGPEINGGCRMTRFPHLSPDGKYLFFAKQFEPYVDTMYWISISAIEEMKPKSPQPGIDSATGRIAFNSYRDGNSEIYVISADGSGLQRLTSNDAKETCPAWSPDGTMIAFVSDRDGNHEIYVMHADGSGQRRLTETPGSEFHPDWSPDGAKIAFRAERDGNVDIYVMSADGSGERRLTSDPATDHRPHWSPDGQRILFGTNRDGNYEVYLMDADGGNKERLTESPAWEIFPRFSPDGAFIAFASGYVNGREADVHIMKTDGSGERVVTSHRGREESLAWSPEGEYIAFQAEFDGNWDIYIMSTDGAFVRRLTEHPATDNWPTWTQSAGRFKKPVP